jgi:hypothetical protein
MYVDIQFNLSLYGCVIDIQLVIMRSREKDIYILISLNGGYDVRELKDCLIVACRTKAVLSELSNIPVYRLVYVFTRLGRNVLVEGDNLILRSSTFYPGRQEGGLRNRNLVKYR